MGYSIGSDYLEEVAFYEKIKEVIKVDKLNGYMGITRKD